VRAPAFRRDAQSAFLLSLDLEDVRSMIPDGARYAERVPANAERVLRFLDDHGARCTFFTVGDVARRHPALVRAIAAAGHEVACHGADHVPLERLGRDGFRDDLRRNLDDLARAGVEDVVGFRAPVLSLTAATPWAHEVLAELGFRYSSSVLAARGKLYGWPGFPARATQTPSGVWELPPNLAGAPPFALPYLGGVYFRVLPFPLVRRLFRRDRARGLPLVAYLHPYDVDTEQERFMHPELGGSRLLNHLMYWNRDRVLPRIAALLAEGAPVTTYRAFVADRLEPQAADGR
jgi:polysaccharide deacetylase family protein (PEP-CTERM system associated)